MKMRKEYVAFAQITDFLIKRHGYRQIDICQKIGLTQTTLSRYLSNVREPTLETVLNLADLFNVSTDFLLGRKMTNTADAEKNNALITAYSAANESDRQTLDFILSKYGYNP